MKTVRPSDEERRLWRDLDDAIRRNEELLAGPTEEELQAAEDEEQAAYLATHRDGCFLAMLPVAGLLAAGILEAMNGIF